MLARAIDLPAMARVVATGVLALTLGPGTWSQTAAAQGGNNGSRIVAKLQHAGVIDNYYPDVVLDVAQTLVRAAPGRWQGVQVNRPYRSGWLNLYQVDARKLPENGLLDEEGVPNFTADNLRGGALAHEETHIIFLNTASSKRLVAATRMKQAKQVDDIIAALAAVDAMGIEAARRHWDPATLAADTQVNQRVGWLMRGALAFVLAHEMGHLKLGHVQYAEPDRVRLQNLTQRQQDERRACPELVDREARERQKLEAAADLEAVKLLGGQCRIGSDGKLRHAIYMLGTGWYFLASMGDKMLEMGRSTDSPFIAKLLQMKLGPRLYQQVVAARARESRRGAVAPAFPLTHPPDATRMQSIEQALGRTPCGGSGLSTSEAQMLEMFRTKMCRDLIKQHQTR